MVEPRFGEAELHHLVPEGHPSAVGEGLFQVLGLRDHRPIVECQLCLDLEAITWKQGQVDRQPGLPTLAGQHLRAQGERDSPLIEPLDEASHLVPINPDRLPVREPHDMGGARRQPHLITEDRLLGGGLDELDRDGEVVDREDRCEHRRPIGKPARPKADGEPLRRDLRAQPLADRGWWQIGHGIVRSVEGERRNGGDRRLRPRLPLRGGLASHGGGMAWARRHPALNGSCMSRDWEKSAGFLTAHCKTPGAWQNGPPALAGSRAKRLRWIKEIFRPRVGNGSTWIARRLRHV